jgi:hypothetical protein
MSWSVPAIYTLYCYVLRESHYHHRYVWIQNCVADHDWIYSTGRTEMNCYQDNSYVCRDVRISFFESCERLQQMTLRFQKRAARRDRTCLFMSDVAYKNSITLHRLGLLHYTRLLLETESLREQDVGCSSPRRCPKVSRSYMHDEESAPGCGTHEKVSLMTFGSDFMEYEKNARN